MNSVVGSFKDGGADLVLSMVHFSPSTQNSKLAIGYSTSFEWLNGKAQLIFESMYLSKL